MKKKIEILFKDLIIQRLANNEYQNNMIMKQLLKTTLFCILCLWLGSCSMIDFSEDCNYTGDVKVLFNWQNLPNGDKKPERMQTIFYPDNGLLSSYQLAGDTLLTGLPATQHEVLSFNQPEGLTFHETDCPCTAYAKADTYTKNGKTYAGNAPGLYAAKTNIVIPVSERAQCVLSPESCTRQVVIDFVIPDNGTVLNVEDISGEISGVQTSYLFMNMEAMLSDADMEYSTIQVQLGIFRSSSRVFGMNPEKVDGNKTDNILAIGLTLSNGTYHQSTLNLTRQFDGFVERIIHITLEVWIRYAGIEVGVANWYTAEEDNIEI